MVELTLIGGLEWSAHNGLIGLFSEIAEDELFEELLYLLVSGFSAASGDIALHALNQLADIELRDLRCRNGAATLR